MASGKIFETTPPFPDDVPVAPMYTISLAQLRAGDSSAASDVLRACQELGFFSLDLNQDPVGEEVIREVDTLFAAGKDILNLPDAVKDQFQHDPPKSFLGYVCASQTLACPAHRVSSESAIASSLGV
jgi:isopenicillin N synthase-like dioxygenase